MQNCHKCSEDPLITRYDQIGIAVTQWDRHWDSSMISNAETICRHSVSSQGGNWVDSGKSTFLKSVPETVAMMKRSLLNSNEQGWGKKLNTIYIHDFFLFIYVQLRDT